MIRTQIQLTEHQANALRELAAERGVSMAELIRRSVDELLERSDRPDRASLRRALRTVFGSFESGVDDLARSHDRSFAEAADG